MKEKLKQHEIDDFHNYKDKIFIVNRPKKIKLHQEKPNHLILSRMIAFKLLEFSEGPTPEKIGHG